MVPFKDLRAGEKFFLGVALFRKMSRTERMRLVSFDGAAKGVLRTTFIHENAASYGFEKDATYTPSFVFVRPYRCCAMIK